MASWTEEQLLELTTSLPAVRTIRHELRALRQRTSGTLRELLQHHTHCHSQWVKRRDCGSLKAEFAAPRWPWRDPALLVPASREK